MEKPWNTKDEKFKSYDNCVLGLKWACTATLLEIGVDSQQYRYSKMLTNKLKPVIRNKRRGLLSKRLLFLYDNALSHSEAYIVETTQKLDFEEMEYFSYSSDFTPCDYYLFDNLKMLYEIDLQWTKKCRKVAQSEKKTFPN